MSNVRVVIVDPPVTGTFTYEGRPATRDRVPDAFAGEAESPMRPCSAVSAGMPYPVAPMEAHRDRFVIEKLAPDVCAVVTR
jgi:hypothetical protein